MAKYNWEKIKSEYVEGVKDEKGDIKYPTLKELSEKYGCSYFYIRHKASEENWKQEKHIYSTKIAQLRQEKKSEILASDNSWTQEHNIYITKISQLKQEKKSEVLASETMESYKSDNNTEI